VYYYISDLETLIQKAGGFFKKTLVILMQKIRPLKIGNVDVMVQNLD